MDHATLDVLEAGLDEVRRSPLREGRVELIVRRPDVEVREVVDEAELSTVAGLVGDNWLTRGSRAGPADPDRQLTLMNVRAAALVARDRERWPLAGDQIYVDLDLSHEHIPSGSRLVVGTAVIQISEPPHLGCSKFADRFGPDALRLVNSDVGKALRLRGVNASVVVSGTVRVGDAVRLV